MDQNIWGPGLWLFLHTLTFNYPVSPSRDDKTRMRRFFMALGDVLPCRYCRENYQKHLKNYPIQLDSKREFVRWLIQIHNEVNEQEGKQQVKELDILSTYEKIYRKKIDLDKDTGLAKIKSQIFDTQSKIIIGLLTGILIFVGMKKIK